MNKEQYNNVINRTLANEPAAQTEDSLTTARAIFNNMGVAIPNGSMKEVYETIKTDDYMGWRACTYEEAQQAANAGVAAIGINDSQIVVLTAQNGEEDAARSAPEVFAHEEISVAGGTELEYYAYSAGTTVNNSNEDSGLEIHYQYKPYNPNYPYQNNFQSSEAYYACLDTYSYDLRNDACYMFTFDQFARFRAHLATLQYQNYTQQENAQAWDDFVDLIHEVVGYIPVLGDILSWYNSAAFIAGLGMGSVQDDISDIRDCADSFSYEKGTDNKVREKDTRIFMVSLLMQNPTGGWQIKIQCSDGSKDLYYLEKETYEIVYLIAALYAYSVTIYKVAPSWSYFSE